MATLTISDAARRCGVDRRTLQRAIRAGRLALTPAHQLTVETLQQAGYLPAAPPHPYAAAAPHVPSPHDTAEAPQSVLELMPQILEQLARIEVALTQVVARVETLCALLVPQGKTIMAPHLTPQSDAAGAPQVNALVPATGRGAMRHRIVDLLAQYPAGLGPTQIRTLLRVHKDLANTCFAMARDGLLRRIGRGKYVVV